MQLFAQLSTDVWYLQIGLFTCRHFWPYCLCMWMLRRDRIDWGCRRVAA